MTQQGFFQVPSHTSDYSAVTYVQWWHWVCWIGNKFAGLLATCFNSVPGMMTTVTWEVDKLLSFGRTKSQASEMTNSNVITAANTQQNWMSCGEKNALGWSERSSAEFGFPTSSFHEDPSPDRGGVHVPNGYEAQTSFRRRTWGAVHNRWLINRIIQFIPNPTITISLVSPIHRSPAEAVWIPRAMFCDASNKKGKKD